MAMYSEASFVNLKSVASESHDKYLASALTVSMSETESQYDRRGCSAAHRVYHQRLDCLKERVVRRVGGLRFSVREKKQSVLLVRSAFVLFQG